MDITKIARNVGPLLKRNSSTILTGLGVAGSLGSAILAVKATPSALNKIELAYYAKNDAKYDAQDEDDRTPIDPVALTQFEVIKVVWRDYTPAILLELATIGCIVGAQSVNLRKQAALISAFSISETTLREFQERMTEEAPVKVRKVRDDIVRDRVEKNPVTTTEVLLIGNGDQLFYEMHTDRYFWSTVQKVRKAVNDLNYRILNQDYASLNEFYSMLGLKTVPQGEELGWNTATGLELDFSTTMTDDDKSAIAIGYVRSPVINFWKGRL